MGFSVYNCATIPAYIVEQLRKLHEPKLGIIVKDLDKILSSSYNDSYHSWVFAIENENVDVVAWALLQMHLGNGAIQIYVHPDYRRKGYATFLWLYAQIYFDPDNLESMPHDKVSRKFFKKVAKYKSIAPLTEVDYVGLQTGDPQPQS